MAEIVFTRFDKLKKIYKEDRYVADALGITPDYYSAIRNGKRNLTKTLKILMDTFIEEHENGNNL